MKRLKNITILLCFLSLVAFISCSAEDKTGVKDNPPEDTEITDGETGGSGTGGSGTETGGSSGTGGSEEGGGETETPPIEPETIEEIDAKDFPENLKGTYRDEKVFKESGDDADYDTEVSLLGQEIWIKGYQMRHKKDGSTGIQVMDMRIKKWKKTTKGGKIIKVEGESFTKTFDKEKNETTIVAKTTIIYDYESKTLSVTFTTYTPDGVDGSFNGKKIN